LGVSHPWLLQALYIYIYLFCFYFIRRALREDSMQLFFLSFRFLAFFSF
jgi:hypothetical protein